MLLNLIECNLDAINTLFFFLFGDHRNGRATVSFAIEITFQGNAVSIMRIGKTREHLKGFAKFLEAFSQTTEGIFTGRKIIEKVCSFIEAEKL